MMVFSALMLSGSQKSGHLVKRCLVGELNKEELELSLVKMQQSLTLEVSLILGVQNALPCVFYPPSSWCVLV